MRQGILGSIAFLNYRSYGEVGCEMLHHLAVAPWNLMELKNAKGICEILVFQRKFQQLYVISNIFSNLQLYSPEN